MKPPSKIIVGTQVFEVVFRSRQVDGMLNDSNYGYTLDTENLIVVDESLADSKKKITLWHEVLHAVGFVYDTSVKPTKKDDFATWEHYFIGIYEEGLVLLIKNNPELIEYLRS